MPSANEEPWFGNWQVVLDLLEVQPVITCSDTTVDVMDGVNI